MRLIKPSFEVLAIMGQDLKHELLPCDTPLALIEKAGRTCYKSEERITNTSAIDFTEMVLKRGHESVIEHSAMTVKFICDRGVTHELVRHRLCAFSQESTRYCNYKGGVTFVIPPWLKWAEGEYSPFSDKWYTSKPKGVDEAPWLWWVACADAEEKYICLLENGWSPQQARSVLPNSLKTEIVVTANFREWRHILKLRTSKAAHPQMRELMIPLLSKLKETIPVIFDYINN